MRDLKIIGESEHHQAIASYIQEHTLIISTLEEMKEEVILKMIRSGYMFTGDRDRLRDAMEDITYMCSPDDDVNKDRVLRSLEYDDSEDESEEGYPIHHPGHGHTQDHFQASACSSGACASDACASGACASDACASDACASDACASDACASDAQE
jgi:hypothetical protein